ncbi:MAG TPA: hypothetical protein VK821_16950 [Dehalococcoidia bacterium]|nr:hypothetical protein [Dehalococcoidia bacterium]
MTIFKTVRTLALASMLALIVMSVPALGVQVQAEPSCGDGFCLDCRVGTVWIRAGDQIKKDGQWYVCDGDTGQLIMVAVGPPHPITIAPIGSVAR